MADKEDFDNINAISNREDDRDGAPVTALPDTLNLVNHADEID